MNGLTTEASGEMEASGKSEQTFHELKEFHTLVFYVNGQEIVDAAVEPEWTLLHYLRNKLRLCGTKLGCAEGGCGACTVMVSRIDRTTGKIFHLAVNACLAPVCSFHGMAITTVEGIGSTRTKLHPVQERIAQAHGSQCGFCTPGIVMSMYALLRSIPKPTMGNLEIAFQGNLCRCTGYRPIIEGFKTFTEDWELSQLSSKFIGRECDNGTKMCALGDACCKKAFTSEPTEVFNVKEFCPYDPTQEAIFPPKLSNTIKGLLMPAITHFYGSLGPGIPATEIMSCDWSGHLLYRSSGIQFMNIYNKAISQPSVIDVITNGFSTLRSAG